MKSSLISLLLIFFWLFPDSIVAKKPRAFVLCTWNIGHFSNGSKNNSTISSLDYEKNLIEFRSFIYDEISPDLICLNEFSPVFGRDKNENEQVASSVLFDGFKTQMIGDQRWYSCNAIFANCKLRHIKLNDFESSLSYLFDNPKANQYYYISADLYIGRKKIKIICTHLYPWDQKIRQNQIIELIEKYKDVKRVLMCGDWNTTNFALFKNAGFTLANNGSLITFPSSKYALDNIIVKGLRLSGVRVLKTELSDHYPLVCNISL